MNELQRDEIGDIYDVAAWGAGYFEIGPRGNLLVWPARCADLKEIVDHMVAERPSTGSVPQGSHFRPKNAR